LAELIHWQLYPLLALVLAGAVVAVEVRGRAASAAAVGATGVALAAAFVVLGAPGLAAAQAPVTLILVAMLLRVDASGGGEETEKAGRDRRGFVAAASLVFAGFMGAVLISAFREILPFGHGAAPPFDAGWALGETGAGNLVSAVLFGLRPMDALAAAAALLGAVVGVLAVVRYREEDGDADAGDGPDS